MVGCYTEAMQVAVVVLVIFTLKNVEGVEDFIRPCKRSDPQINECFAKSINHLVPYLLRGIPEYGVPSIEPLVIPRIQIENGAGSVRIKAQFQNITVKGLTNHTLEDVRTNIKNYRIGLTLSARHLEAYGKYDVSGLVLLFNIRSKGEFRAIFDDAIGVATIHGKEVEQDGVTYMKVDRILVDFKVDRAKFRIKDVTNKNKVLGEAMNTFLNNNWKELVEEVKGAITGAFSKFLKPILNGALLRIPLKEWLLEE